MTIDAEICWTSALDLAALIRQKELSPTEVIRAFLDRIDHINQYVHIDNAVLLGLHAEIQC